MPPICIRVHNAMLALRKVVKRFEFKPKDARGPLLAVMRITMPLLNAMAYQLLNDDSLEAGQVKVLIAYDYRPRLIRESTVVVVVRNEIRMIFSSHL